jgi:hypothetical protein
MGRLEKRDGFAAFILNYDEVVVATLSVLDDLDQITVEVVVADPERSASAPPSPEVMTMLMESGDSGAPADVCHWWYGDRASEVEKEWERRSAGAQLAQRLKMSDPCTRSPNSTF